MRKVGTCSDGYKYICFDDEYMRKSPDCVVYSFGSSSNVCFEEAMLQNRICELHIFDPTSGEITDKRWTYHGYGIGGVNLTETSYWNWRTQAPAICENCPMKTLKMIMEELGHTWVDILKVDVDGAEWRSFEAIFDQIGTVPASQLQIETTGLDITVDKMPQIIDFFKNVSNDGMRVFNIDPNPGTCNRDERHGPSVEYAFMKKRPNGV